MSNRDKEKAIESLKIFEIIFQYPSVSSRSGLSEI